MWKKKAKEKSIVNVPGMGIVKYFLRRKRYVLMLGVCVFAVVIVGQMLDGKRIDSIDSKTRAYAYEEDEPQYKEGYPHIKYPKMPPTDEERYAIIERNSYHRERG